LILSNTNKEEKQNRGKNPNFIYELGKFWGVKRKLKIRSKFGWSMKPLCQNAVIDNYYISYRKPSLVSLCFTRARKTFDLVILID